jgi:hypothetical protein
MLRPKSIVVAVLSLASLLTAFGPAFAGVNFVAPGVAGNVTNLALGGKLYDVAFAGNVSHAAWVSQLDFSNEADAQAAIVALAAELNAAGATTLQFTTPSSTFNFTTGTLWYAADATSLYGETLIKSGSNWQLANPFPGGATAPINSAFPLALDFTLVSTEPWSDLGFGKPGVNGIPQLAGTGTLVGGSAGSVVLTNAKASTPAMLFVSLASTPTPFLGGTLVPVPPVLVIPLGTDAAGAISLPFTWPAGIPSATSLWFQYAISDAAAIHGVSLSNAIQATTP